MNDARIPRMVTRVGDNSLRLVTIGIVAVILLLTTTAGHNWGGDFSQYVHHAVNLVEGRPYTEIGALRSSSSFLGPEAYPPLLPLMLAPVYWLFGLDWFAMKAVVVACFCVALYILTLMAARDLDRVYQPVLVIVLAFNPYFWEFRDRILSDLPFLMFCLLTLYLVERRYIREGSHYRDAEGNKVRYGLLLGLLLYLCLATREVGAVVIAAVVFFEVFHFRKISVATGIALTVVLLFSGVQHLGLKKPAAETVSQQPPAGFTGESVHKAIPTSHLTVIHDTLSLSSIRLQLERYAGSAREIWPNSKNPYIQATGWGVFLLTLAFATAGYFRAVFSGPGVTEIFLGGYLAAILIFAGYQGIRYLVPVIPFFFLYAFRFHAKLLLAGYRRLMLSVAGVFIAFTAVTYVAGFQANARVTPMGITSEPAELFFEHVRKHTPEDSIFVFQKPRVLALLTGRTAVAWPRRRDPETLLAYMQDYRADYLVVSRILWNGNCRPVKTPPEVPEQLMLDFSNDYFLVYKRQPAARQQGDG